MIWVFYEQFLIAASYGLIDIDCQQSVPLGGSITKRSLKERKDPNKTMFPWICFM